MGKPIFAFITTRALPPAPALTPHKMLGTVALVLGLRLRGYPSHRTFPANVVGRREDRKSLTSFNFICLKKTLAPTFHWLSLSHY